MTQIGTVIEGKYEILKEIGRGGMSVVYLAMDKRLNKQWAVKEIRKQGNGKNDEIVVNSLMAEANMMKRLDHPALPRIVDIIDDGITIYVVMDYIEGESLDRILSEYGAQSEEMVISWAKQICDALSYLHSQKPPIIYRDMKPANVMLKPEGNIKIIDFGIAREYKEQSVADTMVLGTKGYAPPEQYSGQTDPRSDIFALGMTMHHLLTNIDPRGGQSYQSVRQINPEISEGIEVIIDKCVQPAAENRYQNCTELLYDLEHPDEITSGFKKAQKRKLRAFLVPAILCVLLFAAGAACRVLGIRMNNSTYEALTSVVTSTSLEEKMASYTSAVEIYPERPEAYLLMIEAYKDEGFFGKQESDRFLAVYNAHKKEIDQTTVEAAELNYQIGLMYFQSYTNDNGGSDFHTRIQKAVPFFAANSENAELNPAFKNAALSDCYYQICTFYKTYILGSTSMLEPSKTDYDALLSTIDRAIETVQGESAYDQLVLYDSVMLLLSDQRIYLAAVGVDQNRVLKTLETAYEHTVVLAPLHQQAKTMKAGIEEQYETYREDIVRAYLNAGVKERMGS